MIDVLGHPIEKGAKVLTSRYWCINKTIVTTVVKVNKVTATVKVPHEYYDHKEKRPVTVHVLVNRYPSQMVVVNAQVDHNATNYPENTI